MTQVVGGRGKEQKEGQGYQGMNMKISAVKTNRSQGAHTDMEYTQNT